MKKFVLYALLLALLLCGCGKEDTDPDVIDFAECPTIAIEDVASLPSLNLESTGATYASDLAATETGVFTLIRNENYEDAFLHFTDFVSGETYPICARPNCAHNDYLCSAYIKNASQLYYNGSYLYWFAGNECQFWRMNTDGTDRKMLFACNEKAESGKLMDIGNAYYQNGKVFFTTFGSMMNPETHEIEIGEHICIGDLESGKYTILSVSFQGNKGSSSLVFNGMYGDLMFFRHTNVLSSLGGYQKNEETYFLLDVKTLEVTVLYQYQWDTNNLDPVAQCSTDTIDDGYLILKIYSGKLKHTTYSDGKEENVWPGDRLFIDLSRKKAYRMTGQDALSLEETVLDGKWIYLRWNEDHTIVEKVAQDLSTGEVIVLPEATRHLNFNPSIQSAGNYYLVRKSGEEGYIAKEDYWAGRMNMIVIPE